ncbi:MAG: PAM68 family protein [Woronichinia naegeliana WA131]|jgi:VIT1/CCC1 family predicted Fe2+/Mn2+ transporter|uniref:PAM68 family protein n=1 Tax=Woronichinia naegeliana WA131 TaxID=2824559 RepID=A0A977KSN0_9CYAN|nr:MAG: PAM68 family protein [Woronichinia naegeliana WA131]
MPAPSSRNRLPFEGKSKKKKVEKKSPIGSSEQNSPFVASKTKRKGQSGTIPEVVSQRMVKRMALFSGVPTGLGMFSFLAFYWIVSHDWLEIPTYVVLAVSLLLFGLGVLGLSYGVLSTSWEENQQGSWWGWQEFRLNFSRTVTAWRTAKSESQTTKES